MRTTDWNYDFSSLPYWSNREAFRDIYDEYYEIPQRDLLCCLYSITEVRMLDYRGFLAILRNKNEPELVLNIAEEFNFCTTFFASQDGKLIFLQPCVYFPERKRAVYPILILDVQKERFSYVMPGNTGIVVRNVQNSATVFTVEINNVRKNRTKRIRIRWLKWHPLDQLPMLHRFLGKR